MQIAFFCNHWAALPALYLLQEKGALAWIGLPEKSNAFQPRLEGIAREWQIPVLRINKRTPPEKAAFTGVDAAFVLGFPYKLSPETLRFPRLGFFNFHLGLLPLYKGIEPIFWQIRNGEPAGGISVHRMEEEYDTGAVAFIEKVPIDKLDTYGLHLNKLAMLAQKCVATLYRKLLVGEEIRWESQPGEKARLWRRPEGKDLHINWEDMTSAEIAALVRAANPVYGGALTLLRGVPFKVHQVSPAGEDPGGEREPGSVAHASPENGLFICTRDRQILRLDVIEGNEGIFSGNRFVSSYAPAPGDRFSTPVFPTVEKPVQQ